MATNKKKTPKKETPSGNFLLPMPEMPKGANLVLDKGNVPIVGLFGRSVEITYAKEFELINSMNVNQSAVFPANKSYMITAVRTRIQKLTKKKFLVKKINPTHNRIWRIADNAPTRHGGRVAGVSPYIRTDGKSKSKLGKWGGKRVKGEGRGPKLTHKDGTPIVPVVNEVINNQ